METFQPQINNYEARQDVAYNHQIQYVDYGSQQYRWPQQTRADDVAGRFLPNTQIQFSLYGYDPRGTFDFSNRNTQVPQFHRNWTPACTHYQQVMPYQSMQNFNWDRYWSAYFGNDRFNSQSSQNNPRQSQFSFDYRFQRTQERFEPQRHDRVPTQNRDFDQPQEQRDSNDNYTRRESDQGKTVIQVRQGESIQAALDKAPPGAIVRVMAGTYREKIRISRDNITLQGEKGAILDYGGTNVSGGAIQISDRQNVRIEGFEIRNIRGGSTPTAIRVDGASRNISIIDNDIHHVESSSNAHAIGVFGTKSTAIQNVVIAGNKVHDLKLGQSEAVVLNGNVDGFKILKNKIYNTDNIAIDIIGGEGVGRAGIDKARNGLIAGNEITNVDSRRNPTYRSACAAGIYVDGGSDVVIEDNVVKNANYGIELASERRGWKTERIQVRRNRLESNNLAGISLGGGSNSNGGVHEVTIENNDFANNARAIWKQSNVGKVNILNNKGG